MKSPKIIYRTPKEVIQLWIKALRSGDYKQTRGTLKDNKGFCCLGVLCDLAAKDGGSKWVKAYLNSSVKEYDGEPETPPKYMMDYLGISEDYVAAIIDLNDIEERSFKDIARKLEKDLMNGVIGNW